MKYLFLGLFLIVGCSSQPKSNRPSWLTEPTRTVDNGYIVYVGTAEDLNPDTAQFKAEGLALEDLANECSFVPKGARIEDRFRETEKSMTKSYVKLGLEFTACEKAKNATTPEQIKEFANNSFTEQIRRFQDLTETGSIPESSQYAEMDVPKDFSPAPAKATGMTDTVHFYAVRQYVAYQKEVVILAPPAAYAANSPESQRFVAAVQPATTQIATYQSQNPELLKAPAPWSKVPHPVPMSRPAALAPKAMPAVQKPQRSERHVKATHSPSAKEIKGKKKKLRNGR
ncbi:MAG: hypothetical protein H7326_10195 [Bdellovibrionaceae bacterium]|nr:hypothetical protein [Pseudobdellovibrionaceae bacterium]